MTADLFIDRDAALSADGRYRWSLSRSWDRSLHKPWCAWIMLNPSTADANSDDATIRKCMSYAHDWGFGGMTVFNLYGYRATDPKELLAVDDPICPRGQTKHYTRILQGMTDVCTTVVCAWGCNPLKDGRATRVASIVLAAGKQRDPGFELKCLGVTKDGHPRHPLYLPANEPLVTFREAEKAA